MERPNLRVTRCCQPETTNYPGRSCMGDSNYRVEFALEMRGPLKFLELTEFSNYQRFTVSCPACCDAYAKTKQHVETTTYLLLSQLFPELVVHKSMAFKIGFHYSEGAGAKAPNARKFCQLAVGCVRLSMHCIIQAQKFGFVAP